MINAPVGLLFSIGGVVGVVGVAESLVLPEPPQEEINNVTKKSVIYLLILNLMVSTFNNLNLNDSVANRNIISIALPTKKEVPSAFLA
jgi:hypothetical protein